MLAWMKLIYTSTSLSILVLFIFDFNEVLLIHLSDFIFSQLSSGIVLWVRDLLSHCDTSYNLAKFFFS